MGKTDKKNQKIEKLCFFREKILEWGEKNIRGFPWRETGDPYKVLVAELMLVRTNSNQVEKIFRDFIYSYPDLETLLDAPKEELKNKLYSLGLNWRIDFLCNIAEEICRKFDGKVPQKREDLKSLPGIGDYVAGAILSISYNKREWIVDSNIARVFSRFFGIESTGEARRSEEIIKLSKDYSQNNKPKKSNLALLDFASLICKSRKPKCPECPVKKRCSSSVRL